MQELICEILCEELPAIPLLKELDNIKPKWLNALEQVGLKSDCEFYYTPRRLVFYHKDFKPCSDEKVEELIGAPREVALKDGKPTRAAQAFCDKAGIDISQMEFKLIKGKEVLYALKRTPGIDAKDLLGGVVRSFLSSLSFGKSMRWGANEFSFIRPIQSIACVLGGKSVEFECFGVRSCAHTYAHKSLGHTPQSFASFDEYKAILERGYVMLDQARRRSHILEQISALELDHAITVGKDTQLLEHIVAITEYPRAVLGSFDERFLAVPSEAIITSMKDNQKYFEVYKSSSTNEISNHFVVIINSPSTDVATIRNGNERVLRARLEDALFFYENDLKLGLEPERLRDMMYVDGLGSMYDKSQREVSVLEHLARVYEIDAPLAKQAIMYSKADLCTQMVGEFGELEGIMGGYYARAMGLDERICSAIYEQYLPKGDGDLPSSEFSMIVALAIKLETLLGLFSKGKIPSGSKDPYALRRAAAGALRIIIKLGVDFDLGEFLLDRAREYGFDGQALVDFVKERLFGLYDANASFVRAAAVGKSLRVVRIDSCVRAVCELISHDDISTFKRVANITKDFSSKDVDAALFDSDYERALYESFMKVALSGDARADLAQLLGLRGVIDGFFDNVMINADDERIKHNRKALVYSIYDAFLSIADLKELSL